MSHEDMEHYRSALEHVVRPEEPADRNDTKHLRLDDYEALYLYDAFVAYAAYDADSKTEEEIALAYAEYVENVVRNEAKGIVRLYAHTDEARAILSHVVAHKRKPVSGLHDNIEAELADTFGADE